MSTKNKLKLSKEVREVFTETEVGALIEDFVSQIQLVAEDVSGLHNKVDRMSNDLTSIKGDVEVIKMDIEIIKHELKNKISRDEFAVLERRVALLENRR